MTDVTTPAQVGDTPPHSTIQAEAVRQLYLSVQGIALLPLFSTLLVVSTWSHVPEPLALLWLMAAYAVMEGRRRICKHYFATKPEVEASPRWGRYITWTALVDGIVWGMGGILFYFPDDAPRQLLLLALIIGIPAGAIYSTAWWPATHRAYSVPAISLTAVGLIVRGNVGEVGIGIGFFFYLFMLFFIVRKANASAMETIALRFEKEDLIEQLSHEKDVAERANLAKSKFLAAASHDLRQPLHAMSLFVAAMEDKVRYPETRNMVGNLQRCTTALESLLQTLLDISKIDAGVIEPRPIDFPLRPLLDRLAAEFSPQASAAGLSFGVACPELTVRSDPTLVERILRNLIGNAIRYTPTGRIDLRCRVDEAGITLDVCDTGIGIPADQHGHVFDEFIQLGNPERDRTKGLGLGLAIVRRLADLLDMRIGLQSAPGRGSTFSISLRAGDPAKAVDEVPTPKAGPDLLQGSIIAVIDDEADVRDGMRTLLESWNCHVIAGENAASVIAQLAATGVMPDIALVDYRLRNNTTGVEAIIHLRELFGPVPAAIITGDTAPERLIEAQASGYQLLHKPVRPAKLRVFLQNMRRSARVIR